jgi:hypothetical protein
MMAMWIEFTRADTRTVVGINMDRVLQIEPEKSGTKLLLDIGPERQFWIEVTEPYKAVMTWVEDGRP